MESFTLNESRDWDMCDRYFDTLLWSSTVSFKFQHQTLSLQTLQWSVCSILHALTYPTITILFFMIIWRHLLYFIKMLLLESLNTTVATFKKYSFSLFFQSFFSHLFKSLNSTIERIIFCMHYLETRYLCSQITRLNKWFQVYHPN